MPKRAKAVDTPLARLMGSATALATLAQSPDGREGNPQTGSPLSPSGMAAAGSVAGQEDDEDEEQE